MGDRALDRQIPRIQQQGIVGLAQRGGRAAAVPPVALANVREHLVIADCLADARQLLRQRSGLVLSAEKQYLAESRLLPVARKHGLGNLAELVDKLKTAADAPLGVEVVEAMTTNESFFFRDKIPFEHFRDTMMPALMAARVREKRIRIWCTACATGQEPYSLAMALKGIGPALAGWKVEIVATDISHEVLAKAQAGIYNQFEVQRGLPIRALVRHFEKSGEMWSLSPRIRQMVRWRRINLLADLRALGQFDIIFCRYVISHFDAPTRRRVLEQLARALPNDGWLVLGADESPSDVTEALRSIAGRPGVFTPNPAYRAAAA